jgi:hypothetical protein
MSMVAALAPGGAAGRGVTASQGTLAAASRASTARISSGRASVSERYGGVTLSEYQLARGRRHRYRQFPAGEHSSLMMTGSSAVEHLLLSRHTGYNLRLVGSVPRTQQADPLHPLVGPCTI